ncbi:pentapeptide repeat-containing protein [Streptomyces sp. NPDC055952]|uniref:pentapeptide repeat-containing protein n=1 Tax=Streptomyces sp. NPDC055952 TaxID=3345663 RepID=UPI0035D89F8A
MPSALPPSWPHCGHDTAPATDPVGCRGIRIPGQDACLAHADPADRTAYLGTLSAGADIDHRSTPFSHRLLAELLNALRDQTTDLPVIGRARFDGSKFDGEADFAEVTFNGPAEFTGAVFDDYGRFKAARFESVASFAGAQFSEASFKRATFADAARFMHAEFRYPSTFSDAHFSGPVIFNLAQFKGDASFHRAEFSEARFSGARFGAIADFSNATFSKTSLLGPFVCAGLVFLQEAVFEAPVTLEIAAAAVYCAGTRWEYRAELRCRYAHLDLRYAVLSAPTAVTFHAAPFRYLGTPLPEAALGSHDSSVHVTSVQGVDASFLVLTDTNLTHCLFTGAFHLDQIRIEGRTTFAPTPEGLQLRGRIWPVKWSKRRTLAEEHHWRAHAAGRTTPSTQPSSPAPRWQISPHHSDPARTPAPEDVSAVYRQLRKAFEDAKNEPGAADFYYGEMEMRRHSRDATPRVERGLLHAYWLLSGYGLRASRAAGWLIAAMITTVVLLMGLGLPQNSPKQEASGTVPADGGRVTFTIDKDDPQNPTHDRFTGKRFEKALNVTLNSVIFRSSGQDLTTTGTYIEMGSRLLEPVLLALAGLAVRGRIKR